jgi:hypothetical protein
VGRPDSLASRLEACLDVLDRLDGESRDTLVRLWAAEDELADARAALERAERRLTIRGVDGKNAAERVARMAAQLPREHEAVAAAERSVRAARRDRDEHQAALELVRLRLKALEVLTSVRSG